MRRILAVLFATALVLTVIAGVASATPPNGEHKITICHATNSATNPFVEITIDVAAWEDPGDSRAHGRHHVNSKIEEPNWDFILADTVCVPTNGSTPPTLPPCECG